MSDFIESLWSHFAIETQEHIEEIELSLVEAERVGAVPELVSRLFRAFHSLKGLAAAMDMTSFARIAHRAEDILGVIRDGDFPLNSDVISLLLASLDEIKGVRESAVMTHTNIEADPALLEKLSETFLAIEHHHEPQTADIPAALSVPQPIHADPEMLVYFFELAREKIASITRLLEPLCVSPGGGSLQSDLQHVDLATEEITQLIYAAKTMEFFNLVEILIRLRDAFTSVNPLDNARQNAITEHLWELHDQIRYIEHTSGDPDAGANRLHSILSEVMHNNIKRIFTSVLDHLDMLVESDHHGDELLIAQSIQTDLSALNSHLAFFMSNNNCNIILMLEDVFSRGARGELHLFNEIIDFTQEEVRHVMEHYPVCSSGNNCSRSTEEIIARMKRIHDYIWAYETGGGADNPIEAFRQFMGGLRIEPELIKILSPDNVRDLMNAMERGEQIYELSAHLESDAEMTASFLTWIETGKSRIITNRSLFIDEKSWYEMLMVSPLPRSEVCQGLKDIDPHGTSLYLKPWVGGFPEKDKLLKAIEDAPERQQRIPDSGALSGNFIRVHGEVLDGFMNLIGEMVLARSRLNHIIRSNTLSRVAAGLKQLERSANDLSAAEILDLLEEHQRELLESDQLLNNSLRRLQESAVGLRVVPVEIVFKRLPRVVRDLARSHGKLVRLEMTGQDVKIDKAMVEILTDPLLHMVRNSVDHGIEMPEVRDRAGKGREAVIRVAATQRGNGILIEVSDDGRGIDTEKVLQKAIERGVVTKEKAAAMTREELLGFIMEPGFSTASVVTETSGRGVGMDVVHTNVMRLGGTISIASEPGRNTVFTLRMPLSAAIQEVLMVEAVGSTLALPGRYVSEVIEITAAELQTVRGEQAIMLRGSFLPLHRLSKLLGYPASVNEKSEKIAVVLSNGSRTIGILVDRVVRRQELFIKDIQESVASLPGVGGASILGDGRVVLILDAEDLLRIARAGVPVAAS